MTFFNYIFTPKLFKQHGDGSLQSYYEPGGFERWGDQIISTLSYMWTFSYYSSPFIITFLYRKGYFVVESIATMAKLSTGIGLLVAISLCMRGFGRSQSRTYAKFVKVLESTKANSQDVSAKEALQQFDFDFKHWPVDFSVKSVSSDQSKIRKELNTSMNIRNKPFWIASLPCEVIAYIAIHTFGLRMIYPGSLKFIQHFLHRLLIQGRSTLIEEHQAKRFKLLTYDRNEIDSIFVDNRERPGSFGKTLVICSEGNAGFYEIGIMATPLALNYSVLGWNHPGFGGSTGKPYPGQDQNAMDAVMQFAIHKLGFLPENIVLFGWSIGGYSSLWAASQYPDIKGVVLDATFDDLLYLAVTRMPSSLSRIIRIAIRDYVNLHNTEFVPHYNGPILMIRRTEDEVIAEDFELSTNRGNYLLLHILKYRFPNIFKSEQIGFVTKLLSSPLEYVNDSNLDNLYLPQIMAYASENSKSYPFDIGENFTTGERNGMAVYLVGKHMHDFKSNHCTPLPLDYFKMPWDIQMDDTDFVFT